MLLLNLVDEEMDFRIQFQAFFPNLAIFTLQLKRHLLWRMGRKKKKKRWTSTASCEVRWREREGDWLHQSGTEVALGEGADVLEIWIGRFF